MFHCYTRKSRVRLEWRLIWSMTGNLNGLWNHVFARIHRIYNRKQTKRGCSGRSVVCVLSRGLSWPAALVSHCLFINSKDLIISENENHTICLYRTFRINSDVCICNGTEESCLCFELCCVLTEDWHGTSTDTQCLFWRHRFHMTVLWFSAKQPDWYQL